MRGIRHVALLFAFGTAGCWSPQEPAADEAAGPRVLVSSAEARAHLTDAPEASYPMFAQVAGVTGVVLHEIDISPAGRVTGARLVHGSPMLAQSAHDAVVDWRFSPFQSDGQAVAARTLVAQMFTGQPATAAINSAVERYTDAMLACVDASERGAHTEADTRCADAIAAAADLESLDRYADVRPRRLHGEAAAALGTNDRAIDSFERVIAELRPIPVFELDRALAFRSLGHSLADSGRDAEAIGAWQQADRLLSDAMAGVDRNSPFRTEAIEHLRTFLPRYADLLDAAGRTDEAGRLRARLTNPQ